MAASTFQLITQYAGGCSFPGPRCFMGALSRWNRLPSTDDTRFHSVSFSFAREEVGVRRKRHLIRSCRPTLTGSAEGQSKQCVKRRKWNSLTWLAVSRSAERERRGKDWKRAVCSWRGMGWMHRCYRLSEGKKNHVRLKGRTHRFCWLAAISDCSWLSSKIIRLVHYHSVERGLAPFGFCSIWFMALKITIVSWGVRRRKPPLATLGLEGTASKPFDKRLEWIRWFSRGKWHGCRQLSYVPGALQMLSLLSVMLEL